MADEETALADLINDEKRHRAEASGAMEFHKQSVSPAADMYVGKVKEFEAFMTKGSNATEADIAKMADVVKDKSSLR